MSKLSLIHICELLASLFMQGIFSSFIHARETARMVKNLKRFEKAGFRSHNFLAQLLSETSTACTIRVRRSSLGRLWNDLGSHAGLHHRNIGLSKRLMQGITDLRSVLERTSFRRKCGFEQHASPFEPETRVMVVLILRR